MRRFTFLIPILLLMIVGLSAEELALGSDTPLADVKMMDVSGRQVSLNDARGEQGLVVIFSCNTCPWVALWEDRYVQLAAAYQPRGFGFIALNSNEATRSQGDGFKSMQTRARDKDYNFYYALDEGSRLARAFGATRTPHIFVFNADDKLVYRGAIDDNARDPRKVEQAYLADALEACLAGDTVTMASTKALGCTIKFPD
jgi:peroxiredoxin